MSQVGTLSSLTYAGLAGLSMVSVVGLLRLWKRLIKGRVEASKRDNELSELRRSLDAARLDAQTKEEGVAVLRKEMHVVKKQLEDERKILDRVRGQSQAMGEQLIGRTQELQEHKEGFARLGEKHAQTLQLLEARTMELKGAEAFLTKADALSGADVIELLKTLNSEIYQTAAMVAEAFEFKAKDEKDGGGRSEEEVAVMEEVYTSANETVGGRMLELLRSSDHREDPTVVQIAFQAGMAAYSNWIVASWDFEDPDDERGLSKIYGAIRQAEEQAVSGRWRALTRTHVPQTEDHELAMYFIDAFVNILLAAEVTKRHSELQEAIESRFAKRIAIIVKGAQRLRRAIGEEVTSCDFEILYIGHDSPFSPLQMDDTLASSFEKGRGEPEPVLCTTELGLARVVKVPGKVGEWDETVLLRPKIALKSGIDEMMAPDNEAPKNEAPEHEAPENEAS